MMANHYRSRVEDEFEEEDYGEYEEDGYEEEGEEEYKQEEEPPSKEQQEFLSLREKLKEKYRQEFKKETAAAFKDLTASQAKRRTTTNDNFGSFFGPSQPVVASRVIDESRSIRENPNIVSKFQKASVRSAKEPADRTTTNKTVVYRKQPKVNEVKKKAQTLKDTRDYSFLLSDDADLPTAEETRPVPSKTSIPNPDRRPAQASAMSGGKPQASKPVRPISNVQVPRNPPPKNPQSQSRGGHVNGSVSNRPRPPTADPRKANGGNVSSRPVMNKALPSRVSAQSTSTNKPLAKAPIHPQLKNRPPSTVPHSSAQKSQLSAQKRPTQSMDRMRNRQLPSSRPQPSKNIPPPRDRHYEHLQKKPIRRSREDGDDEDAIGMIRKMFGYNPNKYAAVDDDVDDMEADYSEILKEERRSAKIARREDEEQLRLIEEEERRERMRKKQKLKQ